MWPHPMFYGSMPMMSGWDDGSSKGQSKGNGGKGSREDRSVFRAAFAEDVDRISAAFRISWFVGLINVELLLFICFSLSDFHLHKKLGTLPWSDWVEAVLKWWRNKEDTEIKISKLEAAVNKAESSALTKAEVDEAKAKSEKEILALKREVEEAHAKSEKEILALKSDLQKNQQELKKAQKKAEDSKWKSWEDEKAFWAWKAERLEHAKKHPTQDLGADRR